MQVHGSSENYRRIGNRGGGKTKYPLPSATKITNQSDSETSRNKFIHSPHFYNIFVPENIEVMKPEEQNGAIQDAFENFDYLLQEPELKQTLGMYSLM